ncbi:hypothetical protein FVR03_21725 [Pontibacter qinzhouensis]|uniref:Uncharacterized protein n=1 Tax=Pontibacter qinzhouensis TaxID=2603253 RepID=A0A5C8J066_9BACT|nr:hypothetical protein [Pontibacter qinzhouensis]TXK26545.1 hypothetical protein FVR03_21725 [Pontibacter qinzhouensis]
MNNICTTTIIVKSLKSVLDSYPELSYHSCYLTNLSKVFVLKLNQLDKSFDLYRQGNILARWIGESFDSNYSRYEIELLASDLISINYTCLPDTEYELTETL